MADTLLSVVNEILRATSQYPNKTAFADTDSTNFIVDRVNDALGNIYSLKPTNVDADGTITVTPSTRLFNGPSGLDLYRVYNWSWRINNSDGDIAVGAVTKEFIITNYPKFETEEGPQPEYIYLDNNQIGIYPLLEAGASNLTIQFSYPANMVKLTATTATFPFADRSEEMAYIKTYAQFEYESLKGLGQPGIAYQKMMDRWGTLVAKYAREKRTGFRGYREHGV